VSPQDVWPPGEAGSLDRFLDVSGHQRGPEERRLPYVLLATPHANPEKESYCQSPLPASSFPPDVPRRRS
jgi:hypothetical protein